MISTVTTHDDDPNANPSSPKATNKGRDNKGPAHAETANAETARRNIQTTEPAAALPWHIVPHAGGVFEGTEVVQLHRLQKTLRQLEAQVQEETEALVHRQNERLREQRRGYQEGFELGLAQWVDAHGELRKHAEYELTNARRHAEACLRELLVTWMDEQLEIAPTPLVSHLLETLTRQLPTRPVVHLRHAAQSERAAQRLHARLVERGWTAHLLEDERLNAGLVVDHPQGRILFDTKQLAQQVMRAHEASDADTLADASREGGTDDHQVASEQNLEVGQLVGAISDTSNTTRTTTLEPRQDAT